MKTITLVRSTAPRKDQRLVIYNIQGRTGSVQFLSTLFGGSQTDQGNPPPTLTLTGTFAAPKPKETPEEREGAPQAIMPAGRLAKMEARVAKMKAKLARNERFIQPVGDTVVVSRREKPAPAPKPAANVGARKAKK